MTENVTYCDKHVLSQIFFSESIVEEMCISWVQSCNQSTVVAESEEGLHWIIATKGYGLVDNS